jgi:hypothetical protein
MSFDFFDNLLLGFIFLNTAATWLSIFFPIDLRVKTIFLGLGIIGLFYFRETFITYVKKIKNSKVILILLPFLILALIVTSNMPLNYDSPLYHIQAIKWIQEYSAVPGLANLHLRFGYNSNVFMLFALTSLNDLTTYQVYSVNFFLFCFIVTYLVCVLHKAFVQRSLGVNFVFRLFLFYYILKSYFNLSSPSPDYIIFIIPLFLISNIIDQNLRSDFREDKFYVMVFSIIYLITVKLSIIPFVLFIPLIIYCNPILLNNYKVIIYCTTLIFIPWLIRNVILSGWLIFPFHNIDLFDVDWKVPEAIVDSEKNTIISWARIAGRLDLDAVHLSLTDWFPLWWANLNVADKIYFVAAILAPAVTMILPFFTKVKIEFKYRVIVSIVFICFIYWFLTAPAFRFGMNYIYILVLTPIFGINFSFLNKVKFKKEFFFMLMLIFLLNFFRITFTNNKDLFYSPNLIAQKQIKIPKEVRFSKIKLRSITVFLPNLDDRCYDFCLPCSHQFINLKNLQQRGNTIQDGFINRYNF